MKKSVKAVPANERKTVLGPVFAIVKVNADAEPKTFGDTPFLSCRKSVPGGFIEMYVFGVAALGKDVAASVELRTKLGKEGNTIHYLRAEVVNDKVKPAHKLYVGTPSDPTVVLDAGMPSMIIEEERRRIQVGFIRK